MTEIQEALFSLRDEEYAEFQAKLAPTIERDLFIGVRVPELRKYAAAIHGTPVCEAFLCSLPHKYYDENLLHSVLLCKIKKYDEAIRRVEEFLPYVDNWAVSDTLQPKVFAKHKEELLPHIKQWIASKETYTCRYGIDQLMNHFLDGDFSDEYPKLVAAVDSDEYYVKMMAAWYFATAFAKQWERTVEYIEQRKLPEWTHKKAIQKACESFRVSDEHKAYLRNMR